MVFRHYINKVKSQIFFVMLFFSCIFTWYYLDQSVSVCVA